MAETPDIASDIYAKLKAWLLAYKPWTDAIEEGNRIWFDADIGPNSPDKPESGDGDFPMSKLTITGGVYNLHTSEVTFVTHSPEGPSHWNETSTYRYTLLQISRLMTVKEIDRLGALAADAFRYAGPKIGLDYVTGVKVSWTTKETDQEPETDLRRYRTEMNITVDTETDGATLLGDPNG